MNSKKYNLQKNITLNYYAGKHVIIQLFGYRPCNYLILNYRFEIFEKMSKLFVLGFLWFLKKDIFLFSNVN